MYKLNSAQCQFKHFIPATGRNKAKQHPSLKLRYPSALSRSNKDEDKCMILNP